MHTNTLMNQALHHLSQGYCSEHILIQRLFEEFAQTPNAYNRIQETVQELHALKVIDDNRIAQQIAERYRHKGNRAVQYQLEQAGIRKSQIQKTLTLLGDEYERALPHAQKIVEQGTQESVSQLELKIMRALSSRSFSFSTVCQVMHTFLKDQAFKGLQLIK